MNDQNISVDKFLTNYEHIALEEKKRLLLNKTNILINFAESEIEEQNLSISSQRIIDIIIQNPDIIFKLNHTFDLSDELDRTGLSLYPAHSRCKYKKIRKRARKLKIREYHRKAFQKFINDLKLFAKIYPNSHEHNFHFHRLKLTANDYFILPKSSIEFYFPFKDIKNLNTYEITRHLSPFNPFRELNQFCRKQEISKILFDTTLQINKLRNFNYKQILKTQIARAARNDYGFEHQKNQVIFENPPPVLWDTILQLTRPDTAKIIKLEYENKKSIQNKKIINVKSDSILGDIGTTIFLYPYPSEESPEYPIGENTIFHRNIITIQSKSKQHIQISAKNLFIQASCWEDIINQTNRVTVKKQYLGDEPYLSKLHKELITIDYETHDFTNTLKEIEIRKKLNKFGLDNEIKFSKKDMNTLIRLLKSDEKESSKKEAYYSHKLLKISQCIHKHFEHPITLLKVKYNLNTENLYQSFEENADQYKMLLENSHLLPNLKSVQIDIHQATSRKQGTTKFENSDYARLAKYFIPFPLK